MGLIRVIALKRQALGLITNINETGRRCRRPGLVCSESVPTGRSFQHGGTSPIRDQWPLQAVVVHVPLMTAQFVPGNSGRWQPTIPWSASHPALVQLWPAATAVPTA